MTSQHIDNSILCKYSFATCLWRISSFAMILYCPDGFKTISNLKIYIFKKMNSNYTNFGPVKCVTIGCDFSSYESV